jgi:hypothetical protein
MGVGKQKAGWQWISPLPARFILFLFHNAHSRRLFCVGNPNTLLSLLPV